MRNILTLILTFAAFLLLLAGCESDKTDSRLHRVADIVSDSPKAALDSLSVIDRNSLKEADRHYYDFLSIKAGDKDFRRQPNDSLILSVLDYYSSHKDENIYPEVLYYCGRVYSDLGDVPTALDYFHQTLNLIGNNSNFSDLKIRALSQCAYLTSLSGLYNESIQYTLQSLEMDRSTQPIDSLNIYYDLHQLSETYLRAKDFRKADSIGKLALSYADNIPKDKLGLSYVILAEVNRQLNNLDDAAKYIRLAETNSDSLQNNTFLVTKAYILLDARNYDSAYEVAEKLIHRTNHHQERAGYHILLSPELRQYVPKDSLDTYIENYRQLLSKHYNENDTRMAISQQSSFNYFLHKRKAQESVSRQKWLGISVIALLVFGLILGIYAVYRRRALNRTLGNLKEALNKVVLLKKSEALLSQQLEEVTQKLNIEIEKRHQSIGLNKTCELKIKSPDISEIEIDKSLREELIDKLTKLNERYEENKINIPIPNEIKKYPVYQTLMEHIAAKKVIPEGSEIWNQLRVTISEVYPSFFEKYELLIGSKKNLDYLHTCMLIKCGFGSARIGELCGRSLNAISTRKGSISECIFGKGNRIKGIDTIIRLM